MKKYIQKSIAILSMFSLTACGFHDSHGAHKENKNNTEEQHIFLNEVPDIPLDSVKEQQDNWEHKDYYGSESLSDFIAHFPNAQDIPEETKNTLIEQFKSSPFFFDNYFLKHLYKKGNLVSGVKDILTMDEFLAIKSYVAGFPPEGATRSVYEEINTSMRWGEKLNDYLLFIYESLASGLQRLAENGYAHLSSQANSSPVDERYQFITDVDRKNGVSPLFRGSLLSEVPTEGDILDDAKSYLSTSKNWNILNKFVRGPYSYAIILFSDQGIPLYQYDLDCEIDNENSEFEVLIPANRKPLKVVKVLDATFKNCPIVIAADSDFSKLDYLKEKVDIYWLLDVVYAQSKHDQNLVELCKHNFKVNDISDSTVSVNQYLEDK